MAVSKNLFIDLTMDPLTDWQKHGGGDQTSATLEPDCSFTLYEELSTDKCWLLEAVLSVNAAPLDPDGARLWAYFHRYDPASYSMDTYSVQVRLEDDAGTKQVVLYDMAAEPSPVAVATLVLDQGWDWTDNAPRIRVRLRLNVDGAGSVRTLYVEAEPSDDLLFDKSAASLSVSKDLDEVGSELQTLDGSLLEVGFGNFGSESSEWESVHVSVADKGTPLPYWPAPVEPDTDHDTPVDNMPGYRIFSPGLGEASIEFDCQNNPGDIYLDGDDLTLSLEVSQGDAPPDRAYGSVPAGLDSHTFTGIDDEQNVTGKAIVCDVSGRCTERQDVVLVDNSGPTLTITDISPEYAKKGTEVVVEFTSHEPLDEATIQVTVGGLDMARDGIATDPYRYTYNPTGDETQGPQTVVVQASDPTENSSQATDVGGVTFDFIIPTIDAAGAWVDEPVRAHGHTFNLYVDVSDVGSDVDPDAFTVTLDDRPLNYEGRDGSTFQFSYLVDDSEDSAGPQSIEVHAHDLADNEAVETLDDAVTFDFQGPTVVLKSATPDPAGPDTDVDLTLTVTDDYSDVDPDSFVVELGGNNVAPNGSDGDDYFFRYHTEEGTDTEGVKDITVTVKDTLDNTTSTDPGALGSVTFDFGAALALANDKVTLICAKGDDGLFHQQHDPELQVTTLPVDDIEYAWNLDPDTAVIAHNDIAPGIIEVTIEPYPDTVWLALEDGDPRKDAIRLAAIVPVEITVPEATWPDEADPDVDVNPWFTFEGTVNGDRFEVTVFLRTLTADAFLVFEKQDREGLVRLSQLSEPGTSYTWSVEALTGADEDFTVSFEHDDGDDDHLGARIVVSHAAGDWPALGDSAELLDPDDLADATFDLKLSQPGHADSYLPCGLRLRKLIGDHHLVFFGQLYLDDHPDVLWKESAVIAAADETFSGWVVDGDGAELDDQPLELNDLLGLASTPTTAPPSDLGDPPWNEDQSFNLRIQAAETTVVPASYFNGRGLHFRELTPETLTLADRLSDDFQDHLPGPHSEPISVKDSDETWVFGDLDSFDLESDFDADPTTLEVVTTALEVTWDGDDLKPRETGTLAVVLLRANDAAVPLSPAVRVSVPVEVTREMGLRVLHGASTTAAPDRLPDAYHQYRYKGELEALVYNLQDEDLIEWTLVDPEIDAVLGADNPLEMDKPGEQEHEGDNPDMQAQHNAVQTRNEPVAAVIPETLTAQDTPYTLQVSLTHLRPLIGGGYKELAGGALHDLKLMVHETPANFDVAILLDRSGSMSGNRWKTACDGADLFATLVNETGVDSRVGVYWFWGNDGNIDSHYPDTAGDYDDEGYYGTFPAAAATPDADKLTISTNRAVTISDPLTDAAEVYEVCHPDGPDHYTALGSGLLHCRDELISHSEDTDAEDNLRGRMILLLSDGMENRKPKLDPVFFSAPDEHWNLFKAPGDIAPTLHPGGPGVRIHSVAMLTSDAWVGKLRDVAAETGGLWSLDVQHIRPDKVDDAFALTQNWFLTSFAGLFGFDESSVMEDPPLAAGNKTTQTLTVNLAMDTLVFYHLSSAADLSKWKFSVKLPDTDDELDLALAASHESITYRHGKKYQMYVVRFPLDIPGHEHRWAGDWTMKLKRKPNAGEGRYGLGALSRQNLQCRMDVLTRPRPRPGDEATVQVQLRDSRGNRIRKARVQTRVYPPGPWVGDAVARRISTDLALVKKLRKSGSKSNRDMSDVADRVLRHMTDNGELQGGRPYNRRLKEVSPGLYQARIKLPEAGDYQLDTTASGKQLFSAPALVNLLKPHLQRLRRSLPLRQLTKELNYLKKRYTTRQPFTWGASRQLGVLFQPSERKSLCEGWLFDDRVIRLDLAPIDRNGRLLGPGWADAVAFHGPAGLNKSWPATDGGDGHYRVEIPLTAISPRFVLSGDVLLADRLELGHPGGLLRPLHDRLSLKGFTAEVLGVRLPIAVQALVGNRSGPYR